MTKHMDKVLESDIQFKPVEEEHIPLLMTWLKEPHVAEFWQETNNESEFRNKFLNQLQARGVRPFIVYALGAPIGYIQDYDASKVGGGWWPDAKPGTFGVDQFIGDPNFINKGVGTTLIKKFVREIFDTMGAKEIITDPEPQNIRAIRAYEKAGFVKIGPIKTPGGDAILMKIER